MIDSVVRPSLMPSLDPFLNSFCTGQMAICNSCIDRAKSCLFAVYFYQVEMQFRILEPFAKSNLDEFQRHVFQNMLWKSREFCTNDPVDR
jgi:hypothetical protein